jgi:hypothetical protein
MRVSKEVAELFAGPHPKPMPFHRLAKILYNIPTLPDSYDVIRWH